jgi:uncharacterized protein YjbI with pentapeptide repeats
MLEGIYFEKEKNTLSNFIHLFISSFLRHDFYSHKDSQKHTEGIMICFRITIAVLLLLAINIGCARQQYIHILKAGNVENWNKWREKNTSVKPNLRRANLINAHLMEADLKEADLSSAHLDSSILMGADFREAFLDSAYLMRANLRGADLDSAYLVGADFEGADLDSAYFLGADLRVANFQGAILSLAKLEGVNLRRANLNSAYLMGADFRGADLKGTSLDSAYLMGADFRGADFGDINLSKIKTFYEAKLDPNVLSEIKENWPEKLATIWDDTKKDWVIDTALLAQVKKPDWHGWPEGKDQGN